MIQDYCNQGARLNSTPLEKKMGESFSAGVSSEKVLEEVKGKIGNVITSSVFANRCLWGPTETRRQGHYLFLMISFQRDSSHFLEKDIPVL